MVVREYHRAGAAFERVFHDDAHVEIDRVHAAVRYFEALQQLALGVEAGLVQMLVAHAEEQVDEVRAGGLPAVQNDRLLGGGHAGAAHQREDEAQQRRGVLADALHLLQLLRRREEHAVEGAEALYQPVGDGVGVHAGDGVEQQQLQRLMVGEGVQPVRAKLLLFAGAVPVVQRHTASPPL